MRGKLAEYSRSFPENPPQTILAWKLSARRSAAKQPGREADDTTFSVSAFGACISPSLHAVEGRERKLVSRLAADFRAELAGELFGPDFLAGSPCI